MFSPPKSLGEGMRRVVDYVGKGSKKPAAYTLEHVPGYRVYDNGVCISGRNVNGFKASLWDDYTDRLKNCADIIGLRFKSYNYDSLLPIKARHRKNNTIIRNRAKENETTGIIHEWFSKHLKTSGNLELVTDFFGRKWKAKQYLYQKNGQSKKLICKAEGKVTNDYDVFCDFAKKLLSIK